MKKTLVFVIVMAITSVLSIVIFSTLTENELAESEGSIQTKIYSTILGEERELIVHLPRDYDSTKLYPVMYVLDGGSQDTHIAAKFDVLTAAGYSPKTIIVGIPNMRSENREYNLTPPFMRIDNDDTDSELGQGDRFLNFMEAELIPFIEKNYPASQIRLLSGNSRGGLLVMYSLLYKPNLFQARFCYSTPFWRQDNIMITKVDDFLSLKDTLKTFIYMSAGENETENIKNGLTEMTKTLKEKAPIGLVVDHSYTPNATHQTNSIISASTGIASWSEYMKR